MKIITLIQSWLKSLRIKIRKLRVQPAGASEPPDLVSTIDRARRNWQQALGEFDQVDHDCTDYVIYKINSAERYYMFLLNQARQEGVRAWPATTVNVVTTPSNTHP